jgi:hypothetical protein
MFSQLEDDRYNATDLARIKDFIFFYVFAMFTLTLEVFGRISDKDGTSDLKYHYRFGGGSREITNTLMISTPIYLIQNIP